MGGRTLESKRILDDSAVRQPAMNIRFSRPSRSRGLRSEPVRRSRAFEPEASPAPIAFLSLSLYGPLRVRGSIRFAAAG